MSVTHSECAHAGMAAGPEGPVALEASADKIRPCCLTIAGSDSGGNAGVQADLRAFHAYGVHGCTVFTALTAQNPDRVRSIHHVPADFVAAQLSAIFETYSVSALKSGMLGSERTICAVAEALRNRKGIIKVVDPVMVATSGARLMDESAAAALKARLLPLADVATPNIPEAEALSGIAITTEKDVREAARKLNGEFGCSVLVKGGHGSDASCKDILFDGGEFFEYSLERIRNPVSTHGTGCALSAAITANLALGGTLRQAVDEAKRYVHNAIGTSYLVGRSCGVLGF
jgi:hydroxymethylpyrimidine/phosphomethylpyrimidine kinase